MIRFLGLQESFEFSISTRKKGINSIMSCIFGIPSGVWSVLIPLLVQIDISMAIHCSATQGFDESDPFSMQQFRSRENHCRRARNRNLHSTLTGITRCDTLLFNGLAAPAFLVRKVDFLPSPFAYGTTILDLSGFLRSLNLEGPKPCDNDESAEQYTSKEHNAHHTDDVNDNTDGPSDSYLPPSANSESCHRHGSDGGGSPPRERRSEGRSFNPFAPSKSALEINNIIKQLLLRHHAGADEGYVYGFHHPDDVAVDALSAGEGHNGRPRLIKIGRSKDHQVRMRQIRNGCGYIPHTVFAHHMPQHAMVERVVHTQLHNSRLREVRCAGCGTKHAEWFQVEVSRAEHLVTLWKAFAGHQPYDEQGEMLPAWRERLEQLDLGDADCWEDFVHGAPPARLMTGSPQELEAETSPTR